MRENASPIVLWINYTLSRLLHLILYYILEETLIRWNMSRWKGNQDDEKPENISYEEKNNIKNIWGCFTWKGPDFRSKEKTEKKHKTKLQIYVRLTSKRI